MTIPGTSRRMSRGGYVLTTRDAVVLSGIFLACITLGASIASFRLVVALVTPVLFAVFVLSVMLRKVLGSSVDESEYRRIARWTFAAYAIHFALGLIISTSSITLLYLGGDALVYHWGALRIIEHWNYGLPLDTLALGREGFYYYLAAIYWLLGPYMVAGLAINCIFAAGLVPLTTDLTNRLFGPRAARFVPPIVVLLPGFLQWTSQLLKEALILFLIVAAVNCAARIMTRVTLAPFLFLIFSLAALMTIRGYIGTILAAVLVLSMTLGSHRWLSALNTSVSSMLLLAFVVVVVGFGYSGYRLTTEYDLKDANNARQDLATSAKSGFAREADISTTRRALSFLPKGLINFTFGPFPWQLHGLRQVAAIPDVLVWWCLVPSAVRGLREGRRRIGRRIVVLVIPASTLLVLLSLVIGNFGAVARARMQILVLLVPFIALGLAQRRPAPVEGPPAAAAMPI